MCISREIAGLPGVQLTIYFLCSFIFQEFFLTLGRRTFRRIFDCFQFMFFCDFSVSNKGRSRQIGISYLGRSRLKQIGRSHLKVVIYRLFTLLHKYSVQSLDEPAKATETVVERYFYWQLFQIYFEGIFYFHNEAFQYSC